MNTLKRAKSVERKTTYTRSSLFVDIHDPVYNGDLPVLNLEDHHLACPQRLVAVVEEQDVSALESRLHRTTAKIDI